MILHRTINECLASNVGISTFKEVWTFLEVVPHLLLPPLSVLLVVCDDATHFSVDGVALPRTVERASASLAPLTT